jgi:small multidrug resistance pump
MKTSAYFFLLLGMFFNSLTSITFKFASLKKYENSKELIFIIGLIFGFFCSYFYAKSLKGVNLNIAFPIFSAVSIIIVTIFSYVLFKENLTLIKTVGLVLIIFGICLINIP